MLNANRLRDDSVIDPNTVANGDPWRSNSINFLKQHVFRVSDQSLSEAQNSNNDRRLEGKLGGTIAYKQDQQESAVQQLRMKKSQKESELNESRDDKKDKLLQVLKEKHKKRVHSRGRSVGIR